VTDVAPLAELESALLTTVAANPDAVARYEAENAGVPLLLAPPEYAPVAGSDAPPAAAFTFLAPGFRWFEPDIGKAIRFSVNERGAATPSHGVDESRAAFSAWSRVSGSSLKVAYDGRSSGGGHRVDGHNQIAFGDPLHEIDDPVNCTGVVASGGVTAATSETVTVGGKQFSRIVEGDVVVNNGFDCLLSNSTVLSEVLTHELGHALGFGHSSERYGETDAALEDATMYFVIHNDGRGASLRVDDSEGARALYPRATTAAALELASTAVPDGLPGRPYAAELRATGGRTPYVWTLSSGVLPPGLTLAQDGRISGDAPEAGAWRFGVSVRDADGTLRTQSLEMRVTGAPAPFLARARYNPTAERLAVAGLYLASSATISINGSVVPSSVRVKYSSTGERLSVFGSASRLRLRASGSNTLVVTYDGRASNTLTF
jgi:hypothetical protein